MSEAPLRAERSAGKSGAALSDRYEAAKLEAHLQRFLHDFGIKVSKARAKFPSAAGSMCALTEEAGELAKAMRDEPRWRVYAEAVQVAAMAARACLEGDSTLDAIREKRGADRPQHGEGDGQ